MSMAPQGVGQRPRQKQAGSTRPPASRGLRMVSGACQIPHPKKADTGGQDSYFIGPEGTAMGVSDGVGEWDKLNVDPRMLADEIMAGASTAVERRAGGVPSVRELARAALREGFRDAHSFGAATALVVALDSEGQTLSVANVGDSGLRQVRKPVQSREIDGGIPFVAARTREQQHFFNCPFQLTRLPQKSEWPSLLAQGKVKLVDAVQKEQMMQDTVEDADLAALPVLEGDLILLGTDGVFDNLYDSEICELVALTVTPLEARQTYLASTGRLRGPGASTDPGALATAIAHAAYHRARDQGAASPFSDNARAQGLRYQGGKMDDITVVCAWLVRTQG